jgi:hypothetical protein
MYPKSYLASEKDEVIDGRTPTDKYKRSQSPGSSLPPKSPHFHRPGEYLKTQRVGFQRCTNWAPAKLLD